MPVVLAIQTSGLNNFVVSLYSLDQASRVRVFVVVVVDGVSAGATTITDVVVVAVVSGVAIVSIFTVVAGGVVGTPSVTTGVVSIGGSASSCLTGASGGASCALGSTWSFHRCCCAHFAD